MRVVWLVSCVFWLTSINMAKRERDDARKEAKLIEDEQKKYDKLLEQVRLREHEFNNHMTAILATHYTCQTYDKLVEAQSEYCRKLMAENKHNKLVLLQDKTFSAFLYEKLMEIEEQGIETGYKSSGEFTHENIPTYQLIEMAGILLDNATEAVKDMPDPQIFVEIRAAGKASLIVRNVYPHVSYAEIQSWFEKGRSSKGACRGLGLYHLKQLCALNGCSICCENTELDGANWISFTLML